MPYICLKFARYIRECVANRKVDVAGQVLSRILFKDLIKLSRLDIEVLVLSGLAPVLQSGKVKLRH